MSEIETQCQWPQVTTFNALNDTNLQILSISIVVDLY